MQIPIYGGSHALLMVLEEQTVCNCAFFWQCFSSVGFGFGIKYLNYNQIHTSITDLLWSTMMVILV